MPCLSTRSVGERKGRSFLPSTGPRIVEMKKALTEPPAPGREARQASASAIQGTANVGCRRRRNCLTHPTRGTPNFGILGGRVKSDSPAFALAVPGARPAPRAPRRARRATGWPTPPGTAQAAERPCASKPCPRTAYVAYRSRSRLREREHFLLQAVYGDGAVPLFDFDADRATAQILRGTKHRPCTTERIKNQVARSRVQPQKVSHKGFWFRRRMVIGLRNDLRDVA